jgi:hypothetical protein
MAGLLQNEDFKTEAELTAAGGAKSQLLNDTKVYVTANSLNKTLNEAIEGGDIGGGGGGINYIQNGGAESDLSGWWEVNDGTAKDVPDNSGTPTQTYTVLSRITSGQLRDTASFRFSNGSSNKKGTSLFYAFTLDNADFTKMLRTALDFADSANVADASFKFFLAHSSDNFASDFNLIRLTPEDLAAGTKTFEAYGQAHHTNTSYRFYIFCADSSTSLLQLDFDNVQVGPDKAVLASRTLACKYTTNSASIPHSTFEIVNYDTIGSFGHDLCGLVTTGVNWKFTADEYGIYQVSAAVRLDFTSGTLDEEEQYLIAIYKNNVQYSYVGSDEVASPAAEISKSRYILDTVELSKGDYIDIRVFQTSGSPVSLAAAHEANYVSVHKIGGNQDAGSGRVVACLLEGYDNTTLITPSNNWYIGGSTVTLDTHGAVKTGSTSLTRASADSWTCPESGNYLISAQVTSDSLSWAAGNTLSITVYSNTTEIMNHYQEIQAANTQSWTATCAPKLYPLSKGDVITWSANSNKSNIGLTDLTRRTYLSIHKIQGNSQPVAGEKIAASYQATGGDSITNNVIEVIYFNSKQHDTHNAVTATNFASQDCRFTAPVYGIYSVKSYLELNASSWTAGQFLFIYIYKNGAVHARKIKEIQGTGTFILQIDVDDEIELNAGDYIDIRMYQTSGSDISLNSDGLRNRLAVHKI